MHIFQWELSFFPEVLSGLVDNGNAVAMRWSCVVANNVAAVAPEMLHEQPHRRLRLGTTSRAERHISLQHFDPHKGLLPQQ